MMMTIDTCAPSTNGYCNTTIESSGCFPISTLEVEDLLLKRLPRESIPDALEEEILVSKIFCFEISSRISTIPSNLSSLPNSKSNK